MLALKTFSQWQTSRTPNDSKRDAMVCSRCGSDDVSRDAWADWDTGKQEWLLRCAFDHAHCHKCDGETSITEAELAPASS